MTEHDELAALLSPRPTGAVWEDFCNRHQATVYRTCYGVLRRRDLAEDAAQETFVTVMKRRESLRPERNVRGWLHRVAVNAALQVMRAERRRGRRDRAAGIERLDRSPVDPSAAAQAAADRQIVRRHLESLPARWRLPVLLRYEEGLTYPEIAAALDVPEGTVASRLHEGLARLRESLGGAGLALTVIDVERAIGLLTPHAVPGTLVASLTGLGRASAASSGAPAGSAAATAGEVGAPGAMTSGAASGATGSLTVAKATAAAAILIAALAIVQAVTRAREWSGPRAGAVAAAPGRAQAGARAPVGPAAAGAETPEASAGPRGPAIAQERNATVGGAPAQPAAAAEPEGPVNFRVRIVDAVSREPVAGAQIEVVSGRSRRRIMVPKGATDANGRLGCRLHDPTDVTFTAAADGYALGVFSPRDDELGEERDWALERAWEVALLVRDSTGTLIEKGVSVRLQWDDQGWRTWEQVRPAGSATWVIGALSPQHQPPGRLRILVQHPGHCPAVVEGLASLVGASGRAEVTVVLSRGAGVAGVVRNDSGRLLPGAIVTLWPAGSRDPLAIKQATTDELGRYRVTGLDPGTWRLYAVGGGFVLPAAVEAALEDGGTFEFSPELPAGGVIEGVLTDENGRPLVGVGVQVSAREGHPVEPWGRYRGTCNTDAEGRFRCVGLPLAVVWRVGCDSHAVRLDAVEATTDRFAVRLTGWVRQAWDPTAMQRALADQQPEEGLRFR